ncbi:unnamed protein product [Ilex paraguariensis]|uniref:Pentatricopeptide repeat-containing protein n=1 Tax=Ilex paraguariensis TaxID=185542 RepID=A0ABC8TTK9_9AQUA
MVASLCKSSGRIKSLYITAKLCHNITIMPMVHAQNGHGRCVLYSTKNEDMVTLTKRILDYSTKREVDRARKIFDQMGRRDSVSWNVMIKGYIENNRMGDARDLFDEMPNKTPVSWNSMIMGYTREKKTNIALKLFIVMPDKDVVSWTAIITALCQASRFDDAWWLFKQMPETNSISWSSIISGFQQNGLTAESLKLFKEMLLIGIQPTSHMFTSSLAASADLAMLSLSEQMYCQLFKRGFERNTHIGNSAISMFIKCGSFHNAWRVFVDLPQPDIVTWNSLIMGFAQHGYGVEAMMIFHQIQKAQFLPDGISFLGVLHGCSHCGLLEEGKQHFYSMEMDYGISPGPEHFAIMVDLLARAGLLKEAYEIIVQMPFEPTTVFWRTLLNGCRIYGDLELGVCVADQILKLEHFNSSACLMALEIYAMAGKWKEVLEMRRHMKEKEARKELGCSWLDIRGRNHIFTTRDESHQESDDIYQTLDLLSYDISQCVSA